MISFKDFGVAWVVKEWKFLNSAMLVVEEAFELPVIELDPSEFPLESLSFSMVSII